jgi:hypothetical protein
MAKTNKMKSLKGKLFSTKLVASIVTLTVFSLLLLAGPASAFILGLTVDDSVVEKGDNLVFTATVDIQAMDTYLPVKQLILGLNGPVSRECIFNLDGTIKSGCEGINIDALRTISSDNRGYGYGYGYNNQNGYGYSFGNGYGYGYDYGVGAMTLEYEVTLDTDYYLAGTYETILEAEIGTETFSKSGEDVTINSASDEEDSSSDDFNGVPETIDTGIGLTLDMNSTGSGKIVVVKYTSNPQASLTIPALGKFFGIDADQAVLNGMGETEIRISYTDAEVSSAGIDESTLRLYYYNEVTSSWEAYNAPKGGVNTTANYVWAKTTHFSTWGIFGTATTVSSGGRSHRNVINETEDVVIPVVNSISNPPEGDGVSTIVDDDQTPSKGFFSTITGAVTGGQAVGIGAAVVFIFLIIVGFVVVRKKKSRK